ncbi:MAG: hypothetical protein KC620_23515, partial [Myxococcales bacterium]|nr:hypothetical protein [Myxococcales bacterium]
MLARRALRFAPVLLLLAFTGCKPTESPAPSDAPKAPAAEAPAPAKPKLVAIANLLSDPSLVEVTTSLKAELARMGYEEGKTIE